MTCVPKNPAVRRFYLRTAATTGIYIVLTIFIALYFHRFHPHGLCAYLLALLPAIALTGFIVTIGLYLAEEKDEFQRNLMVDLLLWGLGGVLVFTSAWGSLRRLSTSGTSTPAGRTSSSVSSSSSVRRFC